MLRRIKFYCQGLCGFNFFGDIDKRKHTTNYVFTLVGGVVS